MRYKMTGQDKDTGEYCSMTVDVKTPDEAYRLASTKNMVVEHICEDLVQDDVRQIRGWTEFFGALVIMVILIMVLIGFARQCNPPLHF